MRVGATQHLRRWARLTRLALHLARGVLTAAFLFPLQSRARRKREIEHWSLELLTILRIRLFLHGMPPAYGEHPLVLVANHVSWLDIFAINSIVPSRFVAKSEVRAWPVMGWLSAKSGTLFIERARRNDTVRINRLVSEALNEGDIFAVFPEGTTNDGTTVLKFHASLLEPAVQAGAAVQPVAVWYERSDGTLSTEVVYDGDKSVWDTLMAITSQPELLAHVCFLAPIHSGERHRRHVAQEAREAILRTLFPQAPRSRTETDDALEAAAH